MSDAPLFGELSLSDALIRDLYRMNPWWRGEAMPVLPTTRRHLVGQIQCRLEIRLAPIIVVRGPRQIGKTTAQLHVIQDLLARGVPPNHLFRVQFDELSELTRLSEPVLRLADWFEVAILGKTLNQAAQDGQNAYLFFDEVQNLEKWSAQLKSLVDSSTTQIVVTGSSALRIELGRDSLAGRINTIEAGVLTLTEIAAFHRLDLGAPFLKDNGLQPLARIEFWRDLAAHGERVQAERDRAFQWFSERGGYPLVHQKEQGDWELLADQLNETVIRRVIQHDLRMGERGRKRDAPLLEEVFRMACRYVGQAPAPLSLAQEVQKTLNANVGSQRILDYLRFLGDTLLLRLIPPMEIRLKQKRGYLKICLADHGLRASWLQEIVPLTPGGLNEDLHLASLAGHIAESVVGATLSSISGLDIAHLPERPDQPEIDFVLTVGTKRIPMEIKYRRNPDPHKSTLAMRRFLDTSVNNAPFGLLVTLSDGVSLPDERIVALPLSTLMLLR